MMRVITYSLIFVAIAAVMLLLGVTVLEGRLRPQGFIIYWLVCTVFTGLTMVVALIDLRAVRRRSRQEARELAQTVLGEFAPKDPERAEE